MQTTARNIINRALRLINVTASGDTATETEYSDAFEALTTMIDSWHTNSMMSYRVAEYSFDTANGSVTIGPTGDIDEAAPMYIQYAMWDGAELAMPSTKEDFRKRFTGVGIPLALYYDRNSPLSSFILGPSPEVQGTLSVGVLVPFIRFSDMDTQVDIPDGCKRMLEYNLAVELAPEYETEASGSVAMTAMNTVAEFKRLNTQVPTLRPPAEYSTLGSEGFDIRSGE